MAKTELIEVFSGRNSPSEITVSLEGVPVEFPDIEGISLGVEIAGEEYLSTKGFISFAAAGKVVFMLGAISNPPKNPTVGRLILYSSQYPLGNPIINEDSDTRLVFDFKQ